jgi:hypothetical protein
MLNIPALCALLVYCLEAGHDNWAVFAAFMMLVVPAANWVTGK